MSKGGKPKKGDPKPDKPAPLSASTSVGCARTVLDCIRGICDAVCEATGKRIQPRDVMDRIPSFEALLTQIEIARALDYGYEVCTTFEQAAPGAARRINPPGAGFTAPTASKPTEPKPPTSAPKQPTPAESADTPNPRAVEDTPPTLPAEKFEQPPAAESDSEPPAPPAGPLEAHNSAGDSTARQSGGESPDPQQQLGL